MPGKRRFVCVRCAEEFIWAPAFSAHLTECDQPLSLDLVLSSLDVVVAGPTECWLAPGKRCPKITVVPKETTQACHVVALIVHGERPPELWLCHECDNRRCLNPAHLYYGTPSQNSRDAWRNGRRTMSDAQKAAMTEGLRRSTKHRARMIEHNRRLAEKNSGDNHWTRRDPEAMERWKAAIAEGKRKKVMPYD